MIHPECHVAAVPVAASFRHLPAHAARPTLFQVISVVVKSADIVVFDLTHLQCMPAQLLPYWQPGESVGQSASVSRHRLFWEASAPPLGLITYVVGRSNDFPACPKAVLSSLELVNSKAGKHVCPQPYECTSSRGISTGRQDQGEGDRGSELSIANRWLEVKLDGSSGLMTSVKVSGV